MSDRLRRADWTVADVPLATARRMVERLHYAAGGANTAVAVHGLMRVGTPEIVRGVAWWMPPTRVAAESVAGDDWRTVLTLTRLVIEPDVPTNAASFLLGRSERLLRADGRWRWLLTYADERQGHTGAIYRAANWTYVGRTGPYPRWEAPDGSQVSHKATVSRTRAEMESLGHRMVGRAHVHKFVKPLEPARELRSPALF